MNSNRKGKVAEREAAKLCRELFGTNARRSQQHNGLAGDADIVDAIPGHRIECKHIAKIHALGIFDKFVALLSLTKRGHGCMDYLAQAMRDAKGETPIVLMRQNGSKKWAVLMSAEDFAKLVKPPQ